MFSFLFNFLYSLVSFIVGFFFILLGILCLILPWSPMIRTDLIEFILANSIAISLYGFGFIVVGLTTVVNLYLSTKRRYTYVRGGTRSIAIHEEIIQQYIASYWKQAFPQHEVPMRLILKRNSVKVIADLPYTPVAERKLFIERIEQDLQDILTRILGYSHEFILALSFQKKE